MEISKESSSYLDSILQKTPRLKTFIDGLDRRYSIKQSMEGFMLHPVPRYRNWPYLLGGMTFICFLLQILTGILLLFYYKPTTTDAYASVVYITNQVPFGWLIRGIHHWSANTMALLVFLHMFRVFLYGAYKSPREWNWVTGMILLLLTLGILFTGYLLPWSQISYWATTVGTEAPGAVPGIGETIKLFLRGSQNVSGLTLSRFFTLHIVVFPFLIIGIAVFHFAFLHGAYHRMHADGSLKQEPFLSKPVFEPYVPHFVTRELMVTVGLFALFILLSTFFPAPMEEKADPLTTPQHIKPEWYFLASYQLLKVAEKLEFLGAWAPKVIGILGQGIIILLFVFLPFLDRSPHRHPKDRPVMMILGVIGVLGFIALTIWGHLS